jgi:S-adenosylmethionine hydrolase
MAEFKFITFLSDYGLEDEFVGVCRGVMKRFAPTVEILDIAHGIPPQDIRAGASVLAQAVGYMPPAVHVAVVDPGVGTKRRAALIGTNAGSMLVGPDNGLLWPAAEALGGAVHAYAIENRSLFLEAPSRTFHGRDIFAPVAARLALGMDPSEAGPEIAVSDLVRLPSEPAQLDDDHIHARVVQIDHFGNLQLNVHRTELEGIGVILGDDLEVRVGGRRFTPMYAQAFSEVQAGKLVVLEDSYRWITLAANQANAQSLLETRRGDAVVLARLRKSTPRAG